MEPALVIKIPKRIASLNFYWLAELVEQYDLVALQETWLFLGILQFHPHFPLMHVNYFSLSSIDFTNGIKAGPRNSYWYRKTLEGLQFSLVIWNHPFVGIYFVNNGTKYREFLDGLYKKKYSQNVFVPSLTEFISLQRLYNYVDTIQPMNGIVC